MRLAISILMLVCCGLSAQPKYINTRHEITQGLVGWWPLNERAGTSAVDFSGNGLNGVLSNGVAWTNGPATAAIGLDGSNDSVEFASNGGNLTEFTLSAWVTISTTNAAQRNIIAKLEPISSRHNYYLLMLNGKVLIGFYNGSTYPSATEAAVTMTSNTWYHVCGTVSGGTITLYINGVQSAQTTSAGTPSPAGTQLLAIGRATDNNNFFWPGNIDDPRIYRRGLNAAEVMSLYVNWDR